MSQEIISVKNIFIISSIVIVMSMVAWPWPILSLVITLAIFLLTVCVSSKSIKNGLLLVLFELFVGSLGRLFSTTNFLPVNLSVRVVMFFGLMLGTIVYLFTNKSARNLLLNNLKRISVYLIILPIILLPIVIGLINNNLGAVYSDANAWIFYGLLLPALSIEYDKEYVNKIFKLLIGTSLTTVLLTLIIYTLYGWGLISLDIFSWLYPWLRQVGWGEVTHVTENLYRVFSQAHIMLLALWSISLTILIKYPQQFLTEKIDRLLLFLTTLILIVNLSRSMWVGAVCLIILLFLTNFNKFIKQLVPIVVITLAAVLLSGLLIGRLGFITLAERINQQPSEPAIASRIVQLKPLLNGIKAHWLVGTGFGGKVGYPSQDPRARANLDSNGLYWTSAFEWGYLDQMLKFGIIIFCLFIFFLIRILYFLFKNNGTINQLLFSALLVIMATHMFSPYLNHPLGIGWLIAAIVAINYNYERLPNNN